MEHSDNCISYASLIFSGIAILWTTGWTFILYLFKPKLKIEIDKGIEGSEKKPLIRIKVTNKRYCSDAINLNIEACTVRDIDKTSHLKIDKVDFLILKCNNDNRIFKAECTQEIENKLKEDGTIFRVRVHATHSYTGFGKAIEQTFRYNKLKNRFEEE